MFFKRVAISFTLSLVALALFAPLTGFAQTADELQQKIDSQNQAISDLEKEIAGYQAQLTTVSKQKNTLANALQTLTLEGKKLNADVQVTEGKIAAANLKLNSLGTSITKASANITDLETAIKASIRDMYMADQSSFAEVLAGGGSFADLWHQAGSEDAARNNMRKTIAELSSTKQVLISSVTTVEKTKNDLTRLRAQLADQQAINKRTQADKSSLLAATKNQEASYQSIIADKQAKKTALENDMRNYESKLKYTATPGVLPKSGSSPFIWPLDKVIITQLFGKTSASGRLYASGSHNGVDFGAPTGTPVKAMATGTVVSSGNADLTCKGASYGIWVFIKYDNGLASVYGHLSLAKVKGGERVGPGDIVAYSGATGYATGPHLHVSVFPSNAVSVTTFNSQACPGKTITIPTAAVNAYLDPMLYFPKYSL